MFVVCEKLGQSGLYEKGMSMIRITKFLFFTSLFLIHPKIVLADRMPLTGWLGVMRYSTDESQISSAGQATPVLGYQAGVTTEVPMGEMFVFRSGALYVQRNSTFNFSSSTGDISVNYSYIDVPLDAVLVGNKFSLTLGADVGIKSSGKLSGTGMWSRISSSNVVTNDQNVIYPLHVGLAYNIKRNFELQLVYESSTELTTLELGGSSSIRVNTSAIGLRIGYSNF